MEDSAKALIRDSDGSKVFAMDTPDNGARKAPALDGDKVLDAPGSATTATTSTGVTLCIQTIWCVTSSLTYSEWSSESRRQQFNGVYIFSFGYAWLKGSW